ncbi:lactate racemase domain-containing protein [Neobacillus pocheonensis]|uniref:lactate racemase domain-containing protein n=1 Tax=Neobacillus pocheonensis TaxID=363869 RepID=UPI003D2B5DB6
MNLPKLVHVKQRFPQNKIKNIELHVKEELKRNLPPIPKGQSIAITVGSRGISSRVLIVKTVVDYLKAIECSPFIIGAMGSHGGGTPEGQLDVLHSLGFTEETVGCPILTSSEVVEVGKTKNGFTLYCDKYAWEADGIIVMNRIKMHTAFRGPNESGLLKMITVGLGKAKGANQLHRQGPSNMSETIREVGGDFLKTGKVIAGIGIVENSFDEVANLEVIRPDEVTQQEQKLLEIAKSYFPRIPIEELDLLVIKTMGKNYSGTGMDTNVIGRNKIFGSPEPEKPSYKRIVVLDLDDASHGNATGIGLADLTTERLYQKLDKQKTYLNCLTSTYVQRGMIPLVLPNDKEAIYAAVQSLGIENPASIRMAVIENTLELEHLFVSEKIASEMNEKADIQSHPIELPFTEAGTLNLTISVH